MVELKAVGRAGTDQIVGNPSTEVKRISILAIFHTNGAASRSKRHSVWLVVRWLVGWLVGWHDWTIMAGSSTRSNGGLAGRQPDDILQPFNTVACNAATNNATMRKLETLADRKPKQSRVIDGVGEKDKLKESGYVCGKQTKNNFEEID